MILKTLTALAACAAFVTTTGSPVSAQRTARQDQSGKAPSSAKPGPSQNQQSSRPKPWWADEKSKKELGLTPEQVKAIDDIYNSAKDELAADREVYDRERKELDKMIAESKVERWVVTRQIDKTETARSATNKLWLMTLYRMHQQLTPEQRVRLQSMAERGRNGRGGERRDPKPAR